MDVETQKRVDRAIASVRRDRARPVADYVFDVFISYRRDPAFETWMTTVVGILRSELGGYLGREAQLFFDVRSIKTGDFWNDDLKSALRTSRCLIPFISLDYFASPWCRAEFATFRSRPGRVIAPIAVHTAGGRLSKRPELANLQYLDVQKYHHSSPVFWQNPTLAPEFEALLRSHAGDIFDVIERAPPFRSNFEFTVPQEESAPRPSSKTRGAAGARAGKVAAIPRPAATSRSMVFLNLPFDLAYRPILEAIVFTVMSCGFMPRSALEASDSLSTPRLERVFELMRGCRFSIHDLASGSRGNVLLEAGMFLAMARSAPSKQKFLIMDDEPQAYRKFLSDLSGLDILFHKRDQQAVVTHVRNWLAVNSRVSVMGSAQIWQKYRSFRDTLPEIGRKIRMAPGSFSFEDLVTIVDSWQRRRR
jgi:hypothetical protein